MQIPILVHADRAGTLQSQIVVQLRALIVSGRLEPGSPVPTTRELGRQLGVSRNTVTGAYEELVDQGYLYTERTVGTFVCRTLPDALLQAGRTEAEPRGGSLYRALNLPLPYTGRGLPGLHRPTPGGVEIDFVMGRMAPRAFPEKAWRRILVECLGGAAERMTEYADPAGLPELRQRIASHLGPSRGMVVSAEQVLLVAGMQQGINLAAHLFVGTNTPVVMEAPTYRGAAFLFESYGGRVLPAPVDRHGLDVERLPPGRVKLVYVTPSHQFPTGVTMPLHRRLALLEWAARTGAWVLEIDHDADFRYEGSPLPSLQSLDRNGCVIHLNSFSRTIGPGLRIGHVVVPCDLIRPALTIKSLMDNGLPWLEQATLAQFMREGGWDTHVKRLRQAHQDRRDALLQALRRHLPAARPSGAEAGTHILLTLPPDGPDATRLKEASRVLGVGLHPLADSPAWFVEHAPDHAHALLMGYTHLDEDRIREGIVRVARALVDIGH